MKKTVIVFILIYILCSLGPAAGDDDHHDDDSSEDGDKPRGYVAECTSYCDVYGYYRPAKICYSSSKMVYCCGHENYRYCCTDGNYSIDGLYPNVSTCPRSSWWLYHWRIIIGLLGSLMAVLLVSACCYYCCVTLFRDKHMNRRARRTGDVPAVSADIEQDCRPRLQLMFDPESPNAFMPPSYDSLPKEPPKYADIIEGHSNPAYESEPITSEEMTEPPPAYQPVDTNQTETAEASNQDNTPNSHY